MITARYIPTGYTLHTDRPDLEVTAYSAEVRGKICGMCFVGKGGKPAWHFIFRSAERLSEKIAETISGREMSIAAKAERKAARSKPTDVAVGDVFRSSWGYDQTNIDYYEVTRVVGAHTVEVRKIGCMSEETAWAQGRSVPAKGEYIGEPMTKRIQSYDGEPYFKVASYANAYRMKPTNVGGVNVYESSAWTAYA